MIRIFAPILFLLPSQAFAENAPYVGLWAEQAAYCNRAVGDGSDSPTKITHSTIEGWEFLCDIKTISKENAGWILRLSCASEGTESPETMHFRIMPNGQLYESGSYGKHYYVRCK